MFLKNKNVIFKIRRSKVTDYAALKGLLPFVIQNGFLYGMYAMIVHTPANQLYQSKCI